MSQKPKKKNGAPGGGSSSSERSTPPVKPAASLAPAASLPEEAEPTAVRASAPAWIFVLLMVLIYWSMVHLDQYAGGFNDKVYQPYTSFKELAELAPKSGPEMLVAKGESVYSQVCIGCHQASGLGAPGQYPPLAGSEWVQGPPNRVIRIPLNGVAGAIHVGTQDWNAQMPPFRGGPLLDDDENLAAVLTYVRQAWGNRAGPITPEQVKVIRAETASRSSQWTSDELLKVE